MIIDDVNKLWITTYNFTILNIYLLRRYPNLIVPRGAGGVRKRGEGRRLKEE